MKTLFMLLTVAVFSGACSKTPEVPKVPDAPKPKVEAPMQQGAPEVKPMPAPNAVGGAPTATDSAATDPKGNMSKAQESNSMPMSGQAGSHSSPALDGAPTTKR